MIHGVGTDMVDIRRIARLLERQEERLTAKIFTPKECVEAEALQGLKKAAHVAKRFAAKEACAKALGCGIGMHAPFHSMQISNTENGKPELALSGAALDYLAVRHPHFTPYVHLSLTDESPYALAYVVIEMRHGGTA